MRMRFGAVAMLALLGTASRLGPRPFLAAAAYVEVRPPTATCTVLVTSYNSEESQTDSTPFVTAAQTRTRWGIVAARWLPLGTRVRMRIDGKDETFTVEDRMHVRNWCKMDIWRQARTEADAWGKRFVPVEVLDVPAGFSCPVQPPTIQYRCPEPVSDWGRRAAQPVRIASNF